MRKFFAGVSVAVLMAVGLFVASPIKGSIVHPQTASACSWIVERNGPTAAHSYLVLGVWHTLYNRIDTWRLTDDCNQSHTKQYELLQWLSNPGDAGNWHGSLRVWVCGSYVGTFTSSNTVTWSGAYNYGTCNPQADNYGSWFYISGAYQSAYTTAV